MSLKSWVLDRVHRINALAGRVDLPAHPAALDATGPAAPRAGSSASETTRGSDAMLANAEHLGAYGALIGAIRDELEHFVASHVRLHLAIADRDRFLLTSIGVRCADAVEARQRLKEFMHEFKPEQVKRYLAREVIGGLQNAAAIDLSQFAGLFDADADAGERADEGGEYRELLAALRSTPTTPAARPYQVSVIGRWTELDAVRPASAASARDGMRVHGTPATPLAGQRCEFDIEDADGRRRVVLPAAVAGRRYMVGSGEACDVRVRATYASRRHAEFWLDNGAWWVSDAGSTNGIRVELPGASRERVRAMAAEEPIELVEGARIVLSARAEGPASDYPCLALRPPAGAAPRITPIAAAPTASPKTPLTSILSARPAASVFALTAHLGSGVRTLELFPGSLPVSVGRSRNQTLVVDRQHEGVSGHHLDIVELDETAALVLVHGDNGVVVDGVPHAAGARLHWKPGQTMVLGASPDDHPTCRLMLARH